MIGCGRKLGPYDCCTVVCGDCLELMKSLPDGCVDAVITDPPYNARKDYGQGTDNLSWSVYSGWIADCIIQMESVSRGPVLVFLSVNGLLEVVPVKRPRHVCAWNKPMSFSPRLGGSAFLPHWEPCLVYGKVWGEGGRVPDYHLPDVWNFNPAQRNGHPCPKPEPLLDFLVAAIPAETILDPFLGSGTTAVAAKKLGRHFLGFEISLEYCKIAEERIALVEAQPNLFQPKAKQLSLGKE